MEKFVRLTAPVGKIDFVIKLGVFLLISGGLNHARHVLTHGLPAQKSYWMNFSEAAFTALPMCAFALLLIGHLNSLQKRMYLQATRDPLTGLPNRRWFMEKTPLVIKPGQALMIVDIDHFKQVNDQFGHDAGDRCLQMMGTHLSDILAHDQHAARIGGEEFAVFMPRVSTDELAATAQAISTGFSFNPDGGTPHVVSTSVGVVLLDKAMPRDDAMKLADQAVYQAKTRGRAQYVLTTDPPADPHTPVAAVLA